MTRRRLLGAFVLVVVVWLGFCVVLLLGARRDAAAGIDAVNAAKRLTSPDDLLRGAPIRPLAAARASFRGTHSKLSHPALAPLKLVPVAGRQLRAADAMAGAATVIASVGVDSVEAAKAALEEPYSSGPGRVTLLRRLHDIAAKADARLRPVGLGPSKALIGAVADKRDEVSEQLDKVRASTRDAATATKGLADMLAGPTTYLVFAANNAEMRAGSGMFLSVGELVMQNGELALGEMRPTGDLTLPPDKAPRIEDADYAKHWSYLKPNEEWRNLGLSPRFAASAQLAVKMHDKPVDGVLALDPVALREMLKATGPVNEVNADNVVRLLLHDQYSVLTKGRTIDAQEARRDVLGGIARSIVDKLSKGPFDNATLASGLSDAAKGRHILAWSSRPAEQAAWEAAGVDGALSADSLGVALLNRGGNKLDQFTDVDVSLKLGEKAELRVKLVNETPPNENVYVAGPFTGSGVAGGDYAGILSVTLPAFAYNVSVEGFDVFTASGRDGPAQVIAVPVTVKRGETVSFTVRFDLPRRGSVRVEPSARVPASEWSTGTRKFRDSRSTRLSWG